MIAEARVVAMRGYHCAVNIFALVWIALYSPPVMAAIAIIVVSFAKIFRLRKPGLVSLILRTVACAAIGAFVSLVLTFAWMFGITALTGKEQNLTPLIWVFFLGPLSAALGQLIALIHWWFGKVPDTALKPTSQNGTI